MANIKFTNVNTVAKLHIYKNGGNGGNRYVEWEIDPSAAYAIDEGDINPEEHQDLQNALLSGQATIDLTELDALTDLGVKNFIAKGLNLDYKLSHEALNDKDVVALDTTTNKVKYVAANGDLAYGVMYEDATSADLYKKLYITGEVTAVADGAIAIGSKLIATTAGKVKASTTSGLHYIGVAQVAAGDGEDITFQITHGTI